MVLIAFNASSSEPEDDIGIAASMGALPADVLAAVFDPVFSATPDLFENLPRATERVVIARKPGYEDGRP